MWYLYLTFSLGENSSVEHRSLGINEIAKRDKARRTAHEVLAREKKKTSLAVSNPQLVWKEPLE
jgi:hypothetical protein